MKKKSMVELQRLDVEEFKETPKIPLIVILDDVRSLNNIGSIFRTSDAFLVEHIYLCGITATPPHPDIRKTALGAENSVAWSHEKDVVALINRLKLQGVVVCSIEQVHNSVSLEKFKVENGKRYAIILGNEVKGVNQEAVDASNFSIEIPQCGTKHSLNVSISGGIVIWDLFKQMHLPE